MVEADDVTDLDPVHVLGGRLVLPVDGEPRLLHRQVQLMAVKQNKLNFKTSNVHLTNIKKVE